MKTTNRLLLVLAPIGILLGPVTRGLADDVLASGGFLEQIRAPAGLHVPTNARPVIVAIVDDAVRVTHQDLHPFIWQNPREIPGNRVDDDGNGLVDDVAGWDMADGDADSSPPPGREAMFYHGTHLAGIVAGLARQVYGQDASKWIRILPVKCLADDADKPYLKQGYKGIQYAADRGADIILVAWSVPHASPGELRILQSASERGALIVGSAGNIAEEHDQYPAAFPSALAVSAVDSRGAKIDRANYGGFVDLVAPGLGIVSAGSASDEAHTSQEGTSMAAAIVAAAAAVVKLQHPGASCDEVVACLKNTAAPVEKAQSGDIYYGGKLGAGLINLAAAAVLPLDAEQATEHPERRNHQGYLVSYRSQEPRVAWDIQPEGSINGFWFTPQRCPGNPGESRVKLFQAGSVGQEPFLDLKIGEWNERRFVPGRQVKAIIERDKAQPDFKILIEYASQPIDQSTLYCRGTVLVNTETIIEDGSGPANYSPRSNGKWLITAPAGKVIHIKFLEFDTEPKVDWVYFFDGAGTREKIMAVYSGPNIPPELTTWHNQALLWFVTDDQRQGQGWKAQVTFQNPPPASDRIAKPGGISTSQAGTPGLGEPWHPTGTSTSNVAKPLRSAPDLSRSASQGAKSECPGN